LISLTVRRMMLASAVLLSLLIVSNTVLSRDVIRISTTTSLYQLGLIDALLKDFTLRTDTKIRYEVIVAGSGESLRLLADGTTCIAFTHAPSMEYELMKKGSIRRLGFVGYNEFVIVGPREDPANVSRASNAVEAFIKIYRSGELGLTKFVSRGDNSGTHQRELWLWNLSGLNPRGRNWYLEVGQGMQQALIIADDVKGYTLSDLGTYLKLLSNGRLRNVIALLNDSKYLVNVYSLYMSGSSRCQAYLDDISKFAEYVMDIGQKVIEEEFKDLVNPAKGHEELVNKSWNYLAMSDANDG